MGQLKQIGGRWAGHGAAGPRAHFLNGEVGQLLDFSDARQLYQDNAGATALTLPNQTVGLAADRSRVRSPLTSYGALQANSSWRPKWGRAPVSRRNLLNGTAVMATQSRTVTAAQHTLSFRGTGTVTLSGASTAGPLVGTGASDTVSLTFTATAGSLTLTVSGSVTEGQLELGAARSAYQAVGATVFDMTESGVPSYGFIRPDLSDDKLTTTFPVALTGDVLVFGRNGSWIESGVTYGAGAAVTIGVNTVTGLPAGLLTAIGDIVGIVAIGRTLTAAERTMALEYHKARGAAGWLVEGAELVANGGYSIDTIWTKGTGWTIGSGVATHAAGVGSDIEQAGLLTVGTAYLLKVDIAAVRASSIMYVHDGSAYMEVVPTLTVGTKRAVFVATATRQLSIRMGSAADADIDNVSLKPLTVAA